MLGGATRLTHAGLSIVEWRPLTGIIPPLNQADWIAEFEKYQQFPEYKLVNQGMSLRDFQFIYWMEYAHRLLGRLMGLWFVIPLVIFWGQGRLSQRLKKQAFLALALGLGQGVLGWYMVKSGLVKDPNVSPYRLTAHLGLAMALFGLLLWAALELLPLSSALISSPKRKKLLQRLSLSSCIALTVTILYGGLVAGLKAGLIYNTFPFMEGQFIPQEWSFYTPLWVNFVENPALVQWIHRWLALSTVTLVLWTCLKAWHSSTSSIFRRAVLFLGGGVLIQASLGIATLLLHVPVILGTLHQGIAVIVWGLGLYLGYLGNKMNLGLGRTRDLV